LTLAHEGRNHFSLSQYALKSSEMKFKFPKGRENDHVHFVCCDVLRESLLLLHWEEKFFQSFCELEAVVVMQQQQQQRCILVNFFLL
jgi:hypothetical protein